MTITSELVAFVVLVLGVISGAWWRVEAVVKAARSEALLAASTASAKAEITAAALAEHRLHVAETYVSKAGMREQTEQIMSAIHAVGTQVGRIEERIDRMAERPPPRRPHGA